MGLRYRWTIDHNRPWNDLIDISLKLYNYASHIKPSINFSTSLPSLILWPYINLNHKKCKLKNYPCLQNGERVRAATASNTIIAARMFAEHLLHQFEQKYNYLGTSNIHEQVTTPGEKMCRQILGSTMYLNCFIYAWLKQPCCEHLKKSQQKHIRRNHMYLLCQRRSIPQMSCIFDITAHPHSHPSIPLE